MSQIFFKTKRRSPSVFSGISALCVATALVLAVVLGPLNRLGLSGLFGLDAGKWAVLYQWLGYAIMAALSATALALLHSAVSKTTNVGGRGIVSTALALALAVLVLRFGPPLSGALQLPDISTDTVSPPRFQSLIDPIYDPTKPAAVFATPLDPDYEQRQRDYLDFVQPVYMPADRTAVVDLLLPLIAANGWTVRAAMPDAGMIEADRHTPWFGRYSQLIVRVRPEGSAVRVDCRVATPGNLNGGIENSQNMRRILSAFREAAARLPKPALPRSMAEVGS